MRRRTKRGPNDSESTGKSGQELPQNQEAPLRPSYPEKSAAREMDALAVLPEAPEATEQTRMDMVTPAAEFDADSMKMNVAGGGFTSEGSQLDESVAGSLEHFRPAEAGEPKMVIETQPEQLGTPPAELTAISPRAPKGYVVLTIGLPGSGKTTWYKRRGVTPLSSDLLRTILFDDITEQRYQGLVFSTLRSLLRARLIAKMPWNYVDATNLSPHERRQWIKMAKSFGYEVQAVFFDVPLEVCLERNSKRDRQVTDEVMRTMAERLRPPSFKEGFSKITVVRVKGAGGTMPGLASDAVDSQQPERLTGNEPDGVPGNEPDVVTAHTD